MGKTLMGGATHKGNIQMLNPQQRELLSQTLEQGGPGFVSSFQQFLEPKGVEEYQDVFQQTYVDPALQALERQILPAIQQRFVDAGAGSSSALNQALAQSATDLSTSLGSQFGSFMQGEQANQLAALSQFLPLIMNQTQTPMIQQRQGILGPLISGGASIASAGLMKSSKNVKENIRNYKKAVAVLRELQVKQYDYKPEAGGKKDKVGFIAEEVPEELTEEKDGVLHVDMYGLLGLAVNAIKMLDGMNKMLETRVDKLDKRLTLLEGEK